MEVDRKKVTELLWDKTFRDHFSDLGSEIKRFLSFPNCKACLESLYQSIVERQEELENFFGEEVQFIDHIEKKVSKPLANVPEEYRRQKGSVTIPARVDRSIRPIRRFLQVWDVESVNEKLDQYPPSRFRVESMSNIDGKLAIMMIELGTKEKAKVTTQEGMDRALEAIEKLRTLVPEEANESLKILEGILAANYSLSGQKALEL